MFNPTLCKERLISGFKCFDTRSPNNHHKTYQTYAQDLEMTDDKLRSDRLLSHAREIVELMEELQLLKSTPLLEKGSVPIYQRQNKH